jgi:hypothetical protein
VEITTDEAFKLIKTLEADLDQAEKRVAEDCAKIAENYDIEYPGKLASGISLRQWIANRIRAKYIKESAHEKDQN